MSYDTDNFEKDVIEQSYKIPVLVDFWAEWCGPCKILGPVLEKLAEQNKDQWVLVKLNTETHPQIAAQYGIRGIPNVKLFIDGEIKDEFVGALPEDAALNWLKKAIPSQYAGQVDNANQLISEKKISEAQNILEDVVIHEPDNRPALALLTKTYVFSDSEKALEIVRKIEYGEYSDIAESIKTIVNLFKFLNNSDTLPDNPIKSTYLNAIRDLKSENFESALESFIEVLGADRNYDNDGSRKACIAIFKYLGEENQTVTKYRPVFSSALYV